MLARRLGDQHQNKIHRFSNKSCITDISIFATDRKNNLELFLAPPQPAILIMTKTQPSVDLVFKPSYMNWERIRIFQDCMTKYCRGSHRYSKRHKTQFSPLHKEKIIFLYSCTITKSIDDSCSIFLRTKLKRKEIDQQSSWWIHPGNNYESLQDFSLLSFKIPSKRDAVILCLGRKR